MLGYKRQAERGFVLVAALMLLSLLTLLAVALYFTGRTSTLISSSAQNSTEGFYYAQTAVNYMIWSTRNDAEFDAFDFRGTPVNDSSAVDPSIFPALTYPSNASSVGDWSELKANFSDPGPTAISDTSSAGVSGQVMYFDNTPLASRAIVWPTSGSGPTLYHISTKLPRYLRLDIDSSGNVTPSIPALPHQDPPRIGKDIPDNGAIVWFTTGNSDWDFQVDPTLTSCSGTPPTDAVACDANPPANNSTGWLRTNGVKSGKEDQHGVVAYAIGYVNGRPSSIIREQIQ